MITKKQLGIGVALFGLLLAIGILAIDWLGAGEQAGIGPTQRIALIGALALFIMGLTLVPLGDRPA